MHVNFKYWNTNLSSFTLWTSKLLTFLQWGCWYLQPKRLLMFWSNCNSPITPRTSHLALGTQILLRVIPPQASSPNCKFIHNFQYHPIEICRTGICTTRKVILLVLTLSTYTFLLTLGVPCAKQNLFMIHGFLPKLNMHWTWEPKNVVWIRQPIINTFKTYCLSIQCTRTLISFAYS